MYTQIFGNYLLNRGVINREQLVHALTLQASTRVKLGMLAINEGYMTASEVEHVVILQTHIDKRFGRLAIKEGYLTEEQVNELLKKQLPAFFLLGQILVDENILTPIQLENLITDYRSEYEIYDLDSHEEQSVLVSHLLDNFEFSEDTRHSAYLKDYLLLLFNNLIRFIGDDFTPLNIMKMPEIPTTYCISQDMEYTDFHVSSAIDIDVTASIAFASRYADELFVEFDEYVQASIEDFLNLHNGLFLINMSNNYSFELTLLPPKTETDAIFSTQKTTYLIPVLFPFGTVHFICSIYPTN